MLLPRKLRKPEEKLLLRNEKKNKERKSKENRC